MSPSIRTETRHQLRPDPSVSRLRSHLRTSSSASQASVNSFARPPQDRMPSHFSQISLNRSESTSTLSMMPGSPGPSLNVPKESSPAFAFHPLRQLSANLFARKGSGRSSPARPPPSRRSSIVVEDVVLGRPSVMDVKGMIAVGTDGGYVAVYDFSQEIKHVLGSESTGECINNLETAQARLTASESFRRCHGCHDMPGSDLYRCWTCCGQHLPL